ncbi:hypothetical protein Taro_023768 [Colocasia esculenta]|uniref:Cyclin-like domain-containing protein n=1 Tax=Colocasia esculenta TaxID=4460 RepID=A0A843UYC0_COLES|nr:hypothetical protein [Colocasia esculenta]
MQPLPSLAPSLYCAEDADDVASWDAGDAWAVPSSPSSLPTVLIFPSSLHDPDRPISDLFEAEVEHMPRADYIAPPLRKVNAFYHFRPVTATLSVNYLDRFLSSQTLPSARATQKGVGWPWQLLSVACLSVASKMEETHVPLLVDLQILEPRFVFEPRTVRRMELLLMSALRWRMRSVTPFDFIDHFAGLLHADCPDGEGYAPLFCRASDIILSTHRASHLMYFGCASWAVLDFLGYRPSEIAAAAVVLCASGEDTEIVSSFYDVVSKEAVEGCRQLMELYATDTRLKGAPGGTAPPPPPSPAGVLDAAACGSCDTTQKSSSEAATHPEAAGAVEPPANKRRRLSATTPCTEESMYEH